MLWTVDGNAVMRGDRLVKQCATAEDAEAYVAKLTDSAVQFAIDYVAPGQQMMNKPIIKPMPNNGVPLTNKPATKVLNQPVSKPLVDPMSNEVMDVMSNPIKNPMLKPMMQPKAKPKVDETQKPVPPMLQPKNATASPSDAPVGK